MIAFDTLKLARRLREAGLSQPQAEAIAEAEAEAFGELASSHLARREDVAALDGRMTALDGRITALRAELKEDIANLRGELKEDMTALDGRITALRAELKEDIAALDGRIADLRSEMYRALGVQGLGIVGLTVTLMKLLG